MNLKRFSRLFSRQVIFSLPVFFTSSILTLECSFSWVCVNRRNFRESCTTDKNMALLMHDTSDPTQDCSFTRFIKPTGLPEHRVKALDQLKTLLKQLQEKAQKKINKKLKMCFCSLSSSQILSWRKVVCTFESKSNEL